MPVIQAISAEVKQTAKELYLQGVGPTIIAKRLNVSKQAVSNWITRGQWKESPLKAMPIPVVMAKGDPLASDSAKVRKLLADSILKQADRLAAERITNASKLGNKKSEQGLAAIAKTIADTADIVFGWSKEAKQGALIVIGDMRNTQPEVSSKPIVEVTSAVSEAAGPRTESPPVEATGSRPEAPDSSAPE